MDVCLKPLLELFKRLEETGIEVEIRKEKNSIYFVVCVTMGDN